MVWRLCCSTKGPKTNLIRPRAKTAQPDATAPTSAPPAAEAGVALPAEQHALPSAAPVVDEEENKSVIEVKAEPEAMVTDDQAGLWLQWA